MDKSKGYEFILFIMFSVGSNFVELFVIFKHNDSTRRKLLKMSQEDSKKENPSYQQGAQSHQTFDLAGASK